MKRLTKLLVAASAVAVGLAWTAIPASADGPTGYGFNDDAPHTITMGGSDTTYKVMQGISDLYNQSLGCLNSTAADANLGKCITTPGTADTTSADTGGAFANWEHDGVLNLYSTGSGAGRASVRASLARDGATCPVTYAGAVNDSPGLTNCKNVDIARSSSSPDATDVTNGDEVGWGFAQDGVQVTVFDSRVNELTAAQPDNGGHGAANLLSAADLFHIWNCDYRTWSQVPSLTAAVAAGEVTDGPIVPWAMNASSGTFGTFSSFVTGTLAQSEGAVIPANWTPNTQAHEYNGAAPGNTQCVRRTNADGISTVKPFENDIKPLVDYPATLSTSASSIDNPANWIWWSSFGELKSFPYKSQYPAGGNIANPVHVAKPAPVENLTPQGSNILSQAYPITRTLYTVTRGVDADCPQSVAHTCNFSLTNGSIPAAPNVFGTAVPDLNVFGTTRASGGVTPVNAIDAHGGLTNGGTSGAIREFIRFMCRTAAQNVGKDPYTGLTFDASITKVLNGNAFTVLKAGTNTTGSRCKVVT